MKKFLLFLTLFLSAVGIASAAPTSFTIKFTGTDNTAITTKNFITTGVEPESQKYIGSCTSVTRVYGSLKFGSTSGAGSITFTLADSYQVNATKIVVNAKTYSSDVATINVNNIEAKSLTDTATDFEYGLNSSEKLSTITIATGGTNTKKSRGYVYSLTVYYDDGTSDDPTDAGLAFAKAKETTTYGASYSVQTLTNSKELSVAYTAEPTTIANFVNNKLTIYQAGDVTITATYNGSDESITRNTSASYTLHVNKATTTLSYSKSTDSYQLTSGDYTTPTLTAPEGETISYESSNTEVATVAEDGTVSPIAKGKAIITAKLVDNPRYNDATDSYTLTVTGILPGIKFETAEYNIAVNDKASFTGQTAKVNDGAAVTIKYASNNSEVATVDENTGIVTLLAAGTAKITATAQANANYDEETASYTINVVDPSEPASFVFTEIYGTSNTINFDEENTVSPKSGLVQFKVSKGSSNHPYFDKSVLRIYSGAIATISVPEGYYITKIEFTGSSGSDYGFNNLKLADEQEGTYTYASDEKTGEWVCGTSEPTSVQFAAYANDKNGKVYIKTITVHYAALSNKEDAGLAFAEPTVNKVVGDAAFTNPLTKPDGLAVTYATDPAESAVATVDANTGEVTVRAAGEVKIVASSAETENYKAGSASYTLKVVDTKLYDTFNASNLTFDGESGYRNFTYTAESGAVYGGFADINANGTTLMIQNQASGKSGIFVSQAPEGYKLHTITVSTAIGSAVLTLYGSTKPYASVSTDGKEIGTFVGGNKDSFNLAGYAGNISAWGVIPTTFSICGADNASSVTEITVIWEVDTRAEAELAYSTTEVTLAEGETLTQPTLNNRNSLPVTYSTNNAEVATVAEDGIITLAGATGTAVITASTDGTATHKPASTTYTITVAKQYIFADTKATLVTDATTLKAGDVIVIAAYGTTSSKDATWNCAMSTSSEKSDYRGVTDVTFNGNHSEITSIPNDVMLIKLEQTQYNETDYWLFKTLNYTGDNGYLGNTAISSNNMRVVPDGNTNTLCYAKIESNDDNTVKVLFNLGTKPSNSNKNGASYNRNYLQYNQGFPRFACYGQEQTNGQVYIYKLETPTTIVREDRTEVTMNEGQGPNTLSAMSLFSTNSTVNNFVVKMNGVTINSAEVVRKENTEGNNNITVNLSGLPYIPGAEFTIAPVVNGKEGHSEVLGIQMPELPTFNLVDSKASLTYDGKEAEAETCNIDAWVKLYITSTVGENAKAFNYYFEIENKSGFENAVWDWLNDDKGYGITYIVKDYLTNVTTQKQGEGDNTVWTPVLPTDPSLYATLEFDVKPYFAFNVTPELASLITEATPAPMAAPARAGEGFVLQNVYSTQVFDQQFNFSASSEVSGVEGVIVDANAPVEFFNLQGVRVDGALAPGIYIRRQGQSVSKVRIN